MKSVSMAVDVEYLLSFLQDELASVTEVRISPVAPSLTQKAMDLPQDYDEESNDVHRLRGVRVRVGSRDFFFPAAWVTSQRMDLVYAQAKEILEFSK